MAGAQLITVGCGVDEDLRVCALAIKLARPQSLLSRITQNTAQTSSSDLTCCLESTAVMST